MIQSKIPSQEFKENFDKIFSKPKKEGAMNIYLAGPMRGYKDFNFPAFFEAANKLREDGHTVFNPAERDTKEWGSQRLKSNTGDENEVASNLGFHGAIALARNCFLADTHYICTTADAIYLLPGWEKSKGAIAERALGIALGLKIVEL